MARKKFNLNDPEEKRIHDRLLTYFKSGKSYDAVINMVALDFPFMNGEVRDCCEHMIFEHFCTSAEGEVNAEVRKIYLFHGNNIDEPAPGVSGNQFLINPEQDIYLSLHVVNPHYTYGPAQSNFTIYLEDVQVNSFRCRMEADERLQTLNIPLNVFKSGVMGDADDKILKVTVQDNNRKDLKYTTDFHLYKGYEMPSDIFKVIWHNILNEEECIKDESIEKKDLKSLGLKMGLECPERFKNLDGIEARFIILDVDKGHEMLFSHKFWFYKDDGGNLTVSKLMCHCTEDNIVDKPFSYSYIPAFIPKAGHYSVAVSVWDDIVWANYLDITDPEESSDSFQTDDFDALLDNFIKEFELQQTLKADIDLEMLNKAGRKISVGGEPGCIFYRDCPDKFMLTVKFDDRFKPTDDIAISIRTSKDEDPCASEVIRQGTISDALCKEFTLEFDSTITEQGSKASDIYVRIHYAGTDPDPDSDSEFDNDPCYEAHYTAVSFEAPEEFINVQGLHLFSTDCDVDDASLLERAYQEMPHTIFAEDDLKNLAVVCKFRNLKHIGSFESKSAMTWMLYDDTGRMICSKPSRFGKIDVTDAAFVGFDRKQIGGWRKGSYRLELQWLGHTLLSAVFKVSDRGLSSEYDPEVIKKKPVIAVPETNGSAMAKLNRMSGLKEVKEKILSRVNFAKLQKLREEAGLPVKRPLLHARFLGNPGTGKTTVARLIGEIYKDMGLLSSGHVVIEERKNFIGRYYDSEGTAVDNALNRAKGGILFIDEAYNLYVENDDKDPGRRVLEYLLTALSDESNNDWMLILAGYPDQMEKMLDSNPGIKSRVDEVFNFEDFDIDTLTEIAETYCDDNNYELSDEARAMLKGLITRDYNLKDKHFGNGRYVNKLMDRIISTNMATRLSKIPNPTPDQLVTIEAEDIVSDNDEAKRISVGGFDEETIDNALKRLDSMVGMNKVKSAIHNFVNISRYLNSQGEKFTGKGLLKWNFTGNTGTGKSTVAQILADILKAMNLIKNNEVTEIKGEEIFNVSDYECNQVLRDAVKRSRNGLLLIDGDAPEFRSSTYRLTNEQVRFKLANLVNDEKTTGAIIIAECSSPNLSIAHSLANNGIYDYDHIFIFDDYTESELYDILCQCLSKYKVTISPDAEVTIREFICKLSCNKEIGFANARTMKNLSRAIFEAVLLRLHETEAEGEPSERIALAGDVESFIWNSTRKKIGYR